MTHAEFARMNGRIEKLRSVLAYIVNQPIVPEGRECEQIHCMNWIAWARRFAKSSIETDLNIEAGRNERAEHIDG